MRGRQSHDERILDVLKAITLYVFIREVNQEAVITVS